MIGSLTLCTSSVPEKYAIVVVPRLSVTVSVRPLTPEDYLAVDFCIVLGAHMNVNPGGGPGPSTLVAKVKARSLQDSRAASPFGLMPWHSAPCPNSYYIEGSPASGSRACDLSIRDIPTNKATLGSFMLF